MEQPPSMDQTPPNLQLAAQNAVEDTGLTITGISVFDFYAFDHDSDVSLTLSVLDGTLLLQTDVANGVTAAEVSGEGTNTITITATLQEISNTLGANGLIYTPGLNFNGNDTLTVTANDFQNATTTKQTTIAVSTVNDAPVLTNAGPTVSVHGGTVLDPDLTVSDYGLDSLNNGLGDYAGATFTIGRDGGGSLDDEFFNGSSGGITLNFIGSGYDVQSGGKTFAFLTYIGGVLTVSFNSSETTATTDLVNNFLQHIGYDNSNATPGSSVTLDYTFNDGAPHFGSNAGQSTTTASIQAEITGPIFANETPTVNASLAAGAMLQPNLTVTDAPLDALNGGAGDYNGATFTVQRDGGANPDDAYYWDSNEKNITLSGNDLVAGGQTIATAGEDNGVLSVSFTSNATTKDVDEVLEHLGYYNTNATPPHSVTLDYTFADGAAKTATGSVEFVACYCAGTLILTDRGEVPVETLEIGDRVVTMSGDERPIKWIGTRSYSGRFAAGRKHILPICIKAGALADNLPRRDLWISPHHAMYLQGLLIEVQDLVNDLTVTQAERVDVVEYFHIELDSHDVIVAEGALSETFVDDDSRGMFNNAHQYKTLYPDAAAAEVRYCAPRVRDGYEVEAVRRAIDARAGRGASRVGAATLRGHVDEMGTDRIAGWAQNGDHPEMPVCLDILADGQLIGQVLANRYRSDLATSGIGSGRHSFEFIPPRGLRLSPGRVEVRRSLDGELLPLPRVA